MKFLTSDLFETFAFDVYDLNTHQLLLLLSLVLVFIIQMIGFNYLQVFYCSAVSYCSSNSNPPVFGFQNELAITLLYHIPLLETFKKKLGLE